MNTTTKITASKETILAALYAFASQRPGLDFANYGDCRTYNAEARAIRKTLSEFRQLFRQVQLSDSITAENLIEAARSAFSGRLSFIQRGDSVAVDYCTGQYWPTEYRNAACAVLASALWDHKRRCMPEPVNGVTDEYGSPRYGLKLLSAGEWLRQSFRKEFGRGIQSRWFN